MKYVQSREQGFTESASAQSLAFSSNVMTGNALVVVVRFAVTSGLASAVGFTVTDSLGQSYVSQGSAHSALIGVRFLSKNLTLSGPCTVTVTPTAAALLTITVLEYSGQTSASMNGLVSLSGADNMPTSGGGAGPSTQRNSGITITAFVQANASQGLTTVDAPFAIRHSLLAGTLFAAGAVADRIPAFQGDTYTPVFHTAAPTTWLLLQGSISGKAPVNFMKEFYDGVPMPGAPWLQGAAPPAIPSNPQPTPSTPVVPDLPDNQLPILARVVTDNTLLTRFTEIVANIVDSLMAQGQLLQTGIETWQIITESAFPDQTGHAGEFLTTDGTTVSWDIISVSDGGSGTVQLSDGAGGFTSVTDFAFGGVQGQLRLPTTASKSRILFDYGGILSPDEWHIGHSNSGGDYFSIQRGIVTYVIVDPTTGELGSQNGITANTRIKCFGYLEATTYVTAGSYVEATTIFKCNGNDGVSGTIYADPGTNLIPVAEVEGGIIKHIYP